MAEQRAKSGSTGPRRLPRGRHALSPEEVLRDQRARLLAAVPGVVAERGYEATSVADLVKAAAVSRNAFYNNFADKRECFAAAHDEGHERLFELLSGRCEEGETVGERIELALAAGLETLAADVDLARLLFVEAPAAGEGIALRYHGWLGRYGTLLRAAAPEVPAEARPAPEVEGVIVGGLASRVASEVLQGRGGDLRELTAPFAEYVLAFYRAGEPGPKEGKLLRFEPEPTADSQAEQRRQASA